MRVFVMERDGIAVLRALQPGDPEWIGPYWLRGELGVGGMGRVFLGQANDGRLAAVKVIRADLGADAQFRARFRHEVAAARKITGPYIANLIDADVDGAAPWLATSYVPGPSLAEAVDSHGPLPPSHVQALAAALVSALAAIHGADVVHRDLKPSNVLLTSDGPRLIDFGIARAAEASTLTHTALVGSPGYLSPEQAQGLRVGPASDIFSLGAVLAFAVTGEGPFGNGQTHALIYRAVHQPPNLDQVPASLRPLVEQCLAKDPNQRPTAAALAAALSSAQPGLGWLPASHSPALAPYLVDPVRHPPTARVRPVPPSSEHHTDLSSPRPGAPAKPEDRTRTAHRPAASAAITVRRTRAAPVRPPASRRGLKISATVAAAAVMLALVYIGVHLGGHQTPPTASTGSQRKPSVGGKTAPSKNPEQSAPAVAAVRSWKFSDVDANNGLLSVSCPTRTFCAASDSSGNVSFFNGSGWSSPQDIDQTGGYLNSVSCAVAAGSVFCAAVDNQGYVVAYNGHTWGQPDQIDPGGNGLVRVSCATPSYCVAVDADGSSFTYNGQGWNEQSNIDDSGGNLWAVSCPRTDFCGAFDLAGYVLTSSGSGWTAPVQVDSSGSLVGGTISCSARTFCMISDSLGYTTALTGRTWRQPVRVDQNRLTSVSCTSDHFCIAVDIAGNFLTYNGSSWSHPAALAPLGQLWSVSCESSRFCVAVGQDGVYTYS
jgi:serine/threonine protein kinase